MLSLQYSGHSRGRAMEPVRELLGERVGDRICNHQHVLAHRLPGLCLAAEIIRCNLVDLRDMMRAGTCTRNIDLAGNRRDVTAVRLKYAPLSRGWARPVVRVQVR